MVRRHAAAEKAAETADALTAWLDAFVAERPRPGAVPVGSGAASRCAGGGREGASGEGETTRRAGAPCDRPCAGSPQGERQAATENVLRLANTDWLEHRLTVGGPAEALTRLRAIAAGPGVIPWRVDLDGAEEDVFHRLVAPPAPHRRVLSAAGCRIVAAELRDAMERQRALALAELARSGRACPFDLHALLPVPGDILALGPDHPDASAWLWVHWGTTRGLRRVETAAAPRPRTRRAPPEVAAVAPEPGQEVWRLGFWSADWTPWRAFAHLAELWPALRFHVQPLYGREGGGA